MSAVLEQALQHPTPKQILNHDIMNCTADGVLGNHLFSGRALGISEPWDMIQLHQDLQPQWDAITAHYSRIGLSFSNNVVWDLDLHQIGAHIGFYPSVFFFGEDECKYWGDRDWRDTVSFINSKNNFMVLADELGVDVPRTLCFDSVTEITPKHMEDFPFPCYLKAAISVSGVGIYRCENQQELLNSMEQFKPEIPVQLQEEVIADKFLNLQYRVVGNELVRLAASEQILDGFAHQGNRVPASHEPWHIVEPMANWLKDRGIKGIFAFDVAVVQTLRGLRFPAIECNPRFNGASYPTLIAQKMDIKEWQALTLNTDIRNLADIDLSGLEYNAQTGEGVILVNWGTILVGKLVVLIAGSDDAQARILESLKQRL